MTTVHDTDVQAIPPIKVHIVQNDLKVKRPKEIRCSHRTIVLTAINPAQLICGVDPARRELHLEVQENQAILTSSISQANDAANTTAGLTTPNGRILNSAVGEYVIPGGANEVWVSAAAYPTRVGVTIVREIS